MTEPGTAMTVTLEINGQVRDLPAHEWNLEGRERRIDIYGIAVRYRTGTKVWPGRCVYWPATGNINNVHGPQDHRQRFHQLSVVGFWADVQEQYRSEHSSVAPRRTA